MNVRHAVGAVRRRLSLVVLTASVLLVLVGAGALADSAAAHDNGYAFTARAVRTKQNNLRFSFNQSFPDWGPHQVRCRGLEPTTLQHGGRGYLQIRCTVLTMNVPDFIWHINGSGQEFTTRSW
jgi:hypothetical protein